MKAGAGVNRETKGTVQGQYKYPGKVHTNKNDNIHKNEAQEIR